MADEKTEELKGSIQLAISNTVHKDRSPEEVRQDLERRLELRLLERIADSLESSSGLQAEIFGAIDAIWKKL